MNQAIRNKIKLIIKMRQENINFMEEHLIKIQRDDIRRLKLALTNELGVNYVVEQSNKLSVWLLEVFKECKV